MSYLTGFRLLLVNGVSYYGGGACPFLESGRGPGVDGGLEVYRDPHRHFGHWQVVHLWSDRSPPSPSLVTGTVTDRPRSSGLPLPPRTHVV